MNTISTQDAPLTLAAIHQFRTLLDIMENFIRTTEEERLSKLSAINCTVSPSNKGEKHSC